MTGRCRPWLSRLDRSLYRRVPRRSAGLAAVLLPVGRLAHRGALWLALAAVLAGTSGRFGRRAAVRGLLASGLASAVANGPVKAVARRQRPSRSRLVARLPGFPAPSTSSFPSAHTAVGFAFAVGAAQELPATAVPLALVASGVALSRVHAGVHYPLDVAGGMAIGAGAGLATRRFWPVAPRRAARAATAAPADVEPSPDGAGLVLVVNPSAGRGGGPEEQLAALLPAAEVVVVDEGDDLEAALRAASGRALALGVAGGDGTVNTAAAVAAEHDLRLVVVPAGTLNHFAGALGLASVDDAAAAVREGRAVAVDRGVIDGRTFLNTASIGDYVELVDAREQLEDRIGKWPAMAVALTQVLRHSAPVEVELDGEPARVWMIFIGNCAYHPAGFGPSWRERLDDGQLDVRIVHADQPWSRARLVASVLTGRLARCRAYEQRFQRELRVRSRQGPLRLARDGETFDGSEEFTIAKAAEPLVVYAPRP
jgi:diacylglycerol kinase family enzyme/membrane-associated phospholipid phosphatase